MRRLMLTLMLLLCIFPVKSEEIIVESKSFTTELFQTLENLLDTIYPAYMTAAEKEVHLQERECLAKNIYFEAKGEPYAGKLAIATVTKNRVNHPNYPKTFCEVVWQQTHNKTAGKRIAQFSWTLDGKSDVPKNYNLYQEALEIADNVLLYDEVSDKIGSEVLFFHATYVKPKWAKKMRKVAKIGRHVFYQPKV